MKKNIFLTLLALFVCIGSVAQNKRAIATVKDVDSLVAIRFKSYDARREAINQDYQATSDSLKKLKLIQDYNKIEAKCTDDVIGLYGKYSALPGVVERLYSLRMMISKTALGKLYDRLPANIRQSDPYARDIRQHLDFNQVGIGDTIADFKAKTLRGEDFQFREFIAQKDVLLVFGDWESLSKDEQLLLQVMYRKVNLEELEIVGVFSQTSKVAFELASMKSGINWLTVCDFKGDHSPLKIAFGIHTSPMCFYIEKGGQVKASSVGVSNDILALVSEKSYK
ncbi:MAG: hypothetical protein RR980_03890 [Mucinivorans sp.]